MSMSKETPKTMILELIEWVESKRVQKKARLFRAYDSFGGEMKRLLLLLIAFFFVVWLAVYEWEVSLAFQGLLDLKAVITASSALLPALAVVIACLALFNPYFEKNAVKVRYKRALDLRKKEIESESRLDDFTDDEKLSLWVLIEIGSKNEFFNLKQLYNYDKTKTVFTEEKLLDRLCK